MPGIVLAVGKASVAAATASATAVVTGPLEAGVLFLKLRLGVQSRGTVRKHISPLFKIEATLVTTVGAGQPGEERA